MRSGFAELTRRYHPDRFTRYTSTDLRTLAAEIFILIRDAYRKLGDESSRQKLLATIGARPSVKVPALERTEPVGVPAVYGEDRLFVYLRLASQADARQDEAVKILESEAQPVVRIDLDKAEQLPQEFFRFEIATAVAGAVLGINPFDQPDVEASKIETKKLFASAEETGALPAETPIFEDDTVALYADAANAEALRPGEGFEAIVAAHLARVKPCDYVALLAYVERNEAHHAVLQEARLAVRDARQVATCLEFGPRFLHSTGQAYKGGPASGVFLQITADPSADVTELVDILLEEKIHAVPVVDEETNELLGIVSTADVLRAVRDVLEAA